MFTEIINPFIKTKEIKPKEEQFIVDYGDVDLRNNGIVIFNSDKKIIIDNLQISSTSRSYIRPRIHATREFNYSAGDGELAPNILLTTGVNNDRATRFDANLAYVANYGNPYLETIIDDTVNSEYKMQNKVPIILPNGGRFIIVGSESYDPEKHSYSVVCIYREIEVNN